MTREDEILRALAAVQTQIGRVHTDLAEHRAEAAEHWGATDARLDRLERSTDSLSPRVTRLEVDGERTRRKLSPPGMPAVRATLPSYDVADAETTQSRLALARAQAEAPVGVARWQTVAQIVGPLAAGLGLLLYAVLAARCGVDAPTPPRHAQGAPSASGTGGLPVP